MGGVVKAAPTTENNLSSCHQINTFGNYPIPCPVLSSYTNLANIEYVLRRFILTIERDTDFITIIYSNIIIIYTPPLPPPKKSSSDHPQVMRSHPNRFIITSIIIYYSLTLLVLLAAVFYLFIYIVDALLPIWIIHSLSLIRYNIVTSSTAYS